MVLSADYLRSRYHLRASEAEAMVNMTNPTSSEEHRNDNVDIVKLRGPFTFTCCFTFTYCNWNSK